MSLWRQAAFVIAGLLTCVFLIASGWAGTTQDGSKGSQKQEVKGDPNKGKEVFQANCEACHNADSTEEKVGPGLKGLFKKGPHKLKGGTEHKQHTVAIIRKQIVEGDSLMPPVGATLSDQEINDLIAYLQTL